MFYPQLVSARAACVARSRVEIWADPAGDERSAAAPAAEFHKCKYWQLGRTGVSHDWRQPNVYLHSKITPWITSCTFCCSTTKTWWRPKNSNMCVRGGWGDSRRVLVKLITLGRGKQTRLGFPVPTIRKSRIRTSALSQTLHIRELNKSLSDLINRKLQRCDCITHVSGFILADL